MKKLMCYWHWVLKSSEPLTRLLGIHLSLTLELLKDYNKKSPIHIFQINTKTQVTQWHTMMVPPMKFFTNQNIKQIISLLELELVLLHKYFKYILFYSNLKFCNLIKGGAATGIARRIKEVVPYAKIIGIDPV